MYTEVMRKAMKESADKATFVDGDYYKPYFFDEPELKVIICGVCGKPKECYPYMPTEMCEGQPPKDKRIYPFGKPIKVTCLCDCDVDRKQKAEQEKHRKKTAAQRKMDCWGYVDGGGIFNRNTAMEHITFDAKDQNGKPKTKSNKHIEACKGYISTISQRLDENKGLFLCGKSGAGKTYAAICFANAVMDRMFKCQFREQWQITRLSQFDDNDRLEMKKLESCTFLVIDDFNPDKLNDYGREILFNLFDARIKRGLPTVFTSNATKSSILNPINDVDKRITDRIIQNCHIRENSEHNYRRKEEVSCNG